MGNLLGCGRRLLLAAVLLIASSAVLAETQPVSLQSSSPSWSTSSGNPRASTADAALAWACTNEGYKNFNPDPTSYAGTSNKASTTCRNPANVYPYYFIAEVFATCSQGTYNGTTHMCDYTGCPSGWTRSGDTCSRADCPAGTIRGSSGACIPQCQGFQTLNSAETACECNAASFNARALGESWLEGTGSIPSSACSGGCMFTTGFGLGGGGKWYAIRGAMQPATCSNMTDGERPPVPNHKPQCGAAEGVLTSSSGTVACVPEGTPDARKPVVNSETKNATYPDGSTVETKSTATTDPTTGATSVSVSTTTTAGPGGGTMGGTPGVSNSTSDSTSPKGTPNDGSDFCTKNPSSMVCKTSTFSGDCQAGPPSCDGDAALCATAKSAFEMKCVFREDSTTALADVPSPGGTAEEIAAGQSALNKNGDKDFDFFKAFQEKRQNYLNFSAVCPVSDQVFRVGLAELHINAQVVCDIGVFVRLLVHIVAYMALAGLFIKKA